MRVLVTGVTGQVGGALVRAAGQTGAHDVESDDIGSDGIEIVGVGRDRLDLERPGGIDGVLDSVRPAAVVNAAAYTAVDRAEQESERAYAVNRDGPGALALACARRGIALVHLSTDYVFDGSGARPYRPEDPVAPLGVYGASKEAGESAIRQVLEDHVILRTAWVYAVRGGNFMNTMLRLGAERDRLQVVGDQKGTPTAANDIAAAIRAILARRAASRPIPPGTYHFTAEGETTWHGFAEAVFARAERVWGRRPSVQAIASTAYPTPTRRPAYSVLDNAALLTAVPELPRRPWREAVDAVLDTRLGIAGEARI